MPPRSRDELEQALRSLPESCLAERIDALNSLARLDQAVDSYARALERATEALAHSVRLGDRGREGSSRLRIAAAHAMLGHPEEAAAQYERTVELAKESGNASLESTARVYLGGIRIQMGRADDGMALVEEGLAGLRACGDDAAYAQALGQRGVHRRNRGDADGALSDLTQAAAFHRDAGDMMSAASVLSTIGTIHRMRGRPLDALAAFREAAGFYDRVGIRQGLAATLTNIGNVHLSRRDYAAAIDDYERALALHRFIGDRVGAALCVGNIGSALMNLDRARAKPVLREAIAAATAAGVVPTRGQATLNLAEIHLRDGMVTEARSLAREAIELFRSTADRLQSSIALVLLGRAALLARDTDPLPILEEAHALAREILIPEVLSSAQAYLAEALRRAGRTDESRALAEAIAANPSASSQASSALLVSRCLPPAAASAPARRALALSQEAGIPVVASAAAGTLARALADTGHAAEARAVLDEAFAALTPNSFVAERRDLLEDAVAALGAIGDEEGARKKKEEVRLLQMSVR